MNSPAGLNGKVENKPIGWLRPFEQNPRKISDEGVSRVADSIRRYGWQQPIVADKNGTIVAGHTRWQAAQQLGLEEVPVHIIEDLNEQKVDGYRLVDNRTGELSDWDVDALAVELREFDEDLVESFFPDVDLEIETVEDANRGPSERELEKAEEKITSVNGTPQHIAHTTEVECPACTALFNVRTSSLPGMDDQTLREIVSNGGTN